MSFILDALRKSETRRQIGEVPRLDFGAEGPNASSSRRRFPAWILLVLPLSLAAVAAGVFLMQPQWLPQQLAFERDATVTPEATEVTEPGDRVDVAADADEEPMDVPVVAQVEPIEEVEPAEPVEEETAAATEERDRRALPDRRRTPQPATGQTVARAAPERERIVSDVDDAMEEIERRVAQTREPSERPESDRRDVEPPVAEREQADRRRIAAPDEAGDEVVEPEWRSQTAEYVRAWELPLSVRRSLPDLKLSIHVFSAEEDGRFVLINGERYVPGDSLGEGARLVDIRREGAIVDYREHRFLLEP